MKKLLSASVVFLTCVTASAQDKHGWYADAKKPGTVDLYLGDRLIGTMDPFDGDWQFSGKAKVNMRKWVYDNNPPKGATGDLPAGESERDRLKREINERKLKEAGIDPAKNAPLEPRPKAGIDETTDKPKCKCEDDCQCKDGRKGEDCPCENCKCAIVGDKARDNGPRPLFGVSRPLFGRPSDKWTVSGKPSNRSEVIGALFGGGATDVPNDSGMNRLTVIGSVAARSQVMADLESAPSLQYWQDKFIVKEYLPTHWRIESGGFEKPKSPEKAVVYVQSSNGDVLFRCDEWRGAEPFAKELRDRVPGYDSAKDPSFKTSPVDSGEEGLLGYWRLAALAGAVGFVAYRWRKQS